MSESSSAPIATWRSRVAPGASAVVVGCVALVGIALTWTYISMRAVMDVGGACASGGPYVPAVTCPDGAALISIAIPVMLLATFAGSGAAMAVHAPNLILPMWAVLFGSLGWNFLEYAVAGPDIVVGWLVCGVMFWLMAAPAVGFIGVEIRSMIAKRERDRLWWLPVYLVLAALSAWFGWWSWHALA